MENVLCCGFCVNTSQTHEVKKCEECGWLYCSDCGHDDICDECYGEDDYYE